MLLSEVTDIDVYFYSCRRRASLEQARRTPQVTGRPQLTQKHFNSYSLPGILLVGDYCNNSQSTYSPTGESPWGTCQATDGYFLGRFTASVTWSKARLKVFFSVSVFGLNAGICVTATPAQPNVIPFVLAHTMPAQPFNSIPIVLLRTLTVRWAQ